MACVLDQINPALVSRVWHGWSLDYIGFLGAYDLEAETGCC
jgi:hypothetical protein